MLKYDWRIVKSPNPKSGRWLIETRGFIRESNSDGSIFWTMAHNWNAHSYAPSKSAALARIMLLRERGEPVSWQGGPIKLGIALISSN